MQPVFQASEHGRQISKEGLENLIGGGARQTTGQGSNECPGGGPVR